MAATDFEDIFVYIGEFGKYQMVTYNLLCLTALFVAMQALNGVFLLKEPNHRCAMSYDNTTDNLYTPTDPYLRDIINTTLPKAAAGANYTFARCDMLRYPGDMNRTDEIVSCPYGYVYERYPHTEMKTTVIEDGGMICSDRWMQTVGQVIFFIGVLIGAFLFGTLSDAIGRKKTFFISICLVTVSSCCSAISGNFWIFSFLKFVVGASTSGIFLPAFVLALELVGPKWRTFAGIIIEVYWAVGTALLGLIAYYIRDWQWLQLITSFPFLLFLVYYWVIPESARWLLSKERKKEAVEVLQKAARFNNRTIPDKFFEELHVEQVSGNVIDLFRHKILLIRMLVIMLNWAVIAMVYYGLAINGDVLPGSIFLNQAINGLVEIPAYILALLVLDRWGRKGPHILGMIIGAIGCLAFVVIELILTQDEKKNQVTLYLVTYFSGKFGVSMSFAIIYIWSAEVLPTVVRNSGLGLASVSARIGSILAPVLTNMGKDIVGPWGKALPMLVFGSLSAVAGLVSVILPETLGHNLPETIEDGVKFGRENAEPLQMTSFRNSMELTNLATAAELTPKEKK